MKDTADLPHVVIVGAGFGGLRAARALAGRKLRVTLLDRNNYHLFQPLLYQAATAGLAPQDIAYPLRAILRRQENAAFRLCEVTGVDFERRILHTSTGEISYDYLILAAGGVTNFFGMQPLAQHAVGLKSLADAVSIRSHVLRMFERAVQEGDAAAFNEMLTFVVAGGGPTGVECSGALSELIRLVLSKDYPCCGARSARVILLEGSGRLLPAMPPELSAATLEALERRGVEVRLNTLVEGFDGHRVTLKNGEVIPARTLIWAAGVRAAPLMDTLGMEQASMGRVKVLPSLQLPGQPRVFVIGDAAFLAGADGAPLPMVAPVAMQQADCAVRSILALERGTPPQDFVYHDRGSMATIGRSQAVASVGRLRLKGFPAWVAWLGVHILQLIGFRNRLLVLINWAWDYFLYDRAVRLIE